MRISTPDVSPGEAPAVSFVSRGYESYCTSFGHEGTWIDMGGKTQK